MTLLEQNPDSTEAKKELDEIFIPMRECNEGDEPINLEDAPPSLADVKVELESVSDSSDWNHKGNGDPCRPYNREGCMQGVECKCSHAPDHNSVRDRLCVFFLPYFVRVNAEFGCWPAGVTFVRIFYSRAVNLAVARIPTTRLICHLVGGGIVRRNGTRSCIHQEKYFFVTNRPPCLNFSRS